MESTHSVVLSYIKNMKNLDVFLIFLAVRLLSVFLIQTFFVPDEYWQSLEVAHKIAFNYGHLTWEWTKGIRSYIPPLVIAGYYKLLEAVGLDIAELLIYGPRVLQALLSAYSDLCFYKWSGTKRWAVFCLASSWFWFYTSSRTLINTLECTLSTIALSKFPWPGKPITDHEGIFLWFVALLFFIRPTSAIIWIPLCLFHLIVHKKLFVYVLTTFYMPIGLAIMSLCVSLDSLVHGSFIITPYNFLKFNVLVDTGSFYGVQPWHWYLSAGVPAILGIQFIPFTLACFTVLKNKRAHVNELALMGTLVFAITIYSFFSHKEFRFLLPLLPIMLYLSSRFLSAWSRKASTLAIWVTAIIIFLGNAVPAWYLGTVHQRGTLDVMPSLREIALKRTNDTSILFLMPCHSTPLYSHLHVNVTTRFLTCLPNLNKIDSYVDEADQFYKSPGSWWYNNYPSNSKLPSHIVMYSTLEPVISDMLQEYKKIKEVFHTNFPLSSRIGQYVLVFQRLNF